MSQTWRASIGGQSATSGDATSGHAAWQAGPPARDLGAVGLVLVAEAAGQGRFLIRVNECDDGGEEYSRVGQQHGPAQQQALPGDGQGYRNLEGIAQVAVGAADGQLP
jgi:hypothetical protein